MTEDLTGWHPDPTGRHEHRYFDGSSWTDNVADQGNMSMDPVAAQAPVAKPAEPSRVDLPAITPEMLAAGPPAAVAPAATAPQPVAAQPVAAQPAAAAPVAHSDDDAFDSDAAKAALELPSERPAVIAALLSVVFPGSGHLYIGAKREVGLGLLVATVVAGFFTYQPVGPWLLGFVIWLAAAGYALYDLRPAIEPALQAHGGGLNALAEVGPAWAWRLVGAGGVVLALSPLLPWYHASESGVSFSASGFEALKLIDLVALAVGVLAVVAAAISLGVLAGKSLPAVLPLVLAVGGAAAWVLVEFRLLFPGAGGLATDLGRAPGILLASAAALTIAFGAASALQSGNRS